MSGAPHVFLDRRDGRLALYLNGDLQFDAADERRYHEPLALVPVGLARLRRPGQGLRVLILGGGDGLALREVLRARDVAEAHLVDYDPVVVALGRRELRALNGGALDDPRVRVHVDDARRALAHARGFDAVLVDLTYPRDVAGAALHDTAFYGAVAAALAPGGVVAVNAVSPELTPEGFGCLAATLGAAGLASVPYAFVLPSFAAEGFGRWGFLFASRRPIADDELRRIMLPPGVGLTVHTVIAGSALPAAASGVMRVAANRSDELLYYLANASPLTWAEPFAALRFGPATVAVGPRLTVAEGFARWLRQPDGQRSLEGLLACLPLGQRGVARGLALEWAHHAELLFRGVDLRALVERARHHASTLPAAWRRELAALAARLRDGMPSMRELLETTWRVFAVVLLALLLANVLFPDNVYAKGTRSSGGQQQEIVFAPQGPSAPFRARLGPQASASSVQSATGAHFRAAPVTVVAPGEPPRAALPALALTRDVRLMDNGTLAYFVPVLGFSFLVHPDRLDVVNAMGEPTVSLHPGALPDETARAIKVQAPLVERAIGEHRRWLDWAAWGAPLPAGRDARSEMAELERIRDAFARIDARWVDPPRVAPLPSPSDSTPVLPGVFLRGAAGARARELILVHPDGTVTARPIAAPPALGDLDRFVYTALAYHAWARPDSGLAGVMAEWRARFALPQVLAAPR